MLKIKKYPKRSPYYILRGTVAGVRVFETTQTADRLDAERYRIKREKEIFASAGLGEERPVTVAEAMTAYLDAGGEARFIVPLLDHFKDKALRDVGQAELDGAAQALHPGCKPATTMRQVYGPMKAVMKHALEAEMPGVAYRKVKNPKVETVPAQYGTDAQSVNRRFSGLIVRPVSDPGYGVLMASANGL